MRIYFNQITFSRLSPPPPSTRGRSPILEMQSVICAVVVAAAAATATDDVYNLYEIIQGYTIDGLVGSDGVGSTNRTASTNW